MAAAHDAAAHWAADRTMFDDHSDDDRVSERRRSNAEGAKHRREESASRREAGEDKQWVLSALEQHEAGLTRYAERLTGDVNTARDVVQHVFLQLCDHPPADRNGHLASWLFTVCHNRAMDFRRRSVRTSSLEAMAADALGCGTLDPAKQVEAEDAAAVVREVMEALPDVQRLVVQFWSAGFCYREIGELLDKTEGYVRVASHRAWQTIRNHPRIRKLLHDAKD